MNKKKKIRLSDIAEKLNISTVTVSKALANKDGVGDDLRKQIKDLAYEMGYQTKKENTSGFDNTDNGTGNIGILIPNKFFTRTSSYYWYLFNFISQELLSRKYYSIMELITYEDEENLNLPHMINDKKVDGLIILGQVSNAYLEAIHSHYDNFILLDFYTNSMYYDSVSDDNYYCSYMLTNYVIANGHEKIRFVGNIGATTSIQDRYMGFLKAMMENGLDSPVTDTIDDRDEKGISIDLKLPFDNMPTAFVCNCDETAARLINTLNENGYRVPEDISVTGFDNYLTQNKLNIGLTTVFIKPEDTAKVAADLILDKINGREYIKGRHLISGNIIIRDSVRKL